MGGKKLALTELQTFLEGREVETFSAFGYRPGNGLAYGGGRGQSGEGGDKTHHHHIQHQLAAQFFRKTCGGNPIVVHAIIRRDRA